MSSFILAALKPALLELLDKARKQAPGYIDALVAQLVILLPASIDKVTAAFRTLYTDITTRVVAWLPAARPRLIVLVDKTVAWAKVQAGKL